MAQMQGMSPVRFTLGNTFTHWVWSPFPLAVLVVLVLIGTWYLRADWLLATRGRRWPAGRRASFFGGLLAIELAIGSPVAAYTMRYFQAHVIQHLLLMVVAPPLLALGAPSTLLLQTASRRTKERWLGVLRSSWFALLSHPFTSWFLYFGVMILFFLTSLINTAMNHMALMDVINVVFLVGATLYWWPMVGVDPIIHWKMGYGARMLNILLGSAIEAFLGVAILAMTHPMASMYSLSSTHSGGALLWVSTEVVTLAAFIPIYFQWMRSEDRAAARADARAERVAAEPANAVPANPSAPRSAWEAAFFAKAGDLPAVTRASAPGEAPTA
ncbi:MAG TPA: cytochrome c oxidase assembly protein [Acidimicrobiales bacterium]|nr:cytochrome c oxidase assembly protein [Acidimicrobiales bacterium]